MRNQRKTAVRVAYFIWKSRLIITLPLHVNMFTDMHPWNADRLVKNGADPTAVKYLKSVQWAPFLVFMVGMGGLYITMFAVFSVITDPFWVTLGAIVLGTSVVLLLSYQQSARFARARLCRAMAQLTLVLEAWDQEPTSYSIYNLAVRSYLTRTPAGVRLLRQASWQVTRSLRAMAETAGFDKSRPEWENSGKVVLWISKKLNDPRRRAVGWECAAELATFAGGVIQVPPSVSVAAAANYAIRPTRRSRLTWFAHIARTPVVSGVVVAITAAVLRKAFG